MIEAAFWLAVLWVAWVFPGYALLVWLRASTFAGGRTRAGSRAADRPARVSVIVAVHNGQELIRDKIADCLRLDWPAEALEVLVASDGSTDATEELVRQVADPRVRLIAGARKGKEAAQGRAIAVARGEILAFTDAGVSLAPAALRRLVAGFAEPSVGCVSGVDRIVDADGRAVGENAFVRYDTWLKNQESQAGSTVGNSGWLFAVRRELSADWPAATDSDFGILLRAVHAGYRGVVAPDAVAAGRTVASDGDELRRKVRTMVRGMAVLASHRDLLDPLRHGFFSLQLLSHKLLRWLLPIPMAALLITAGLLASDSPLFAGAFWAQVLFWSLGLLAPRPRIPRYFAVTTAAAIIAGWKFLRGERYVLWSPSVRRLTRVDSLR